MLRGLGALPMAAALQSYGRMSREISSESHAKTQTVQVLLEGAFTLVLERNPNRITAFVPKHPKIGHHVYFNDPEMALKEGSHRFTLSQEGLEHYAEPYINPGFKDFVAHTDVWKRGAELITIELPFPNSINFSGRPLKVRFKADKREGLMPTSHILEYYTKNFSHPKLSCPELGRECEPSPNCPPGVARYYFGVAPLEGHPDPEHAKEFFNFILEQFPKLVKRLSLSYIEPGPRSRHDDDKRGSVIREDTTQASMRPAVYDSNAKAPRLLQVAELVDCQLAGPIIFRP
jgi:hypothetical protein